MDSWLYDVESNYHGGDLAKALVSAAEFVERIGEDQVVAIQWMNDDATGHDVLVIHRKK
jgi:hypothetical protein